MRGVEIRNLHWRDVDLLRKSFTIRRTKTAAGLRSIPMNDDAYVAVMQLWSRASGIGAHSLSTTSSRRARTVRSTLSDFREVGEQHGAT